MAKCIVEKVQFDILGRELVAAIIEAYKQPEMQKRRDQWLNSPEGQAYRIREAQRQADLRSKSRKSNGIKEAIPNV